MNSTGALAPAGALDHLEVRLPEPFPTKSFYRPDELAKTLDTSMGQIYRLIRGGAIGHVHLGRLIRIPAGEYARILREGVSFPGKHE